MYYIQAVDARTGDLVVCDSRTFPDLESAKAEAKRAQEISERLNGGPFAIRVQIVNYKGEIIELS